MRSIAQWPWRRQLCMVNTHTLYGVRAEKEPTSEARCCRRRHSWGPICRAPAELSGANLEGVTWRGLRLAVLMYPWRACGHVYHAT